MLLLGKKIKSLRNKYKYTQTELATLVGVTKSTIAAYENDTRLPSYEVLIRMSKTFKVSIDSILLDRTDSVINIDGLNPEQVQLVENLIENLRKAEICNSLSNDKKYIDNTIIK